MKRILGVLALLCTAAVSLTLLVTGCDSPNSPDLPAQPYHAATVYSLPAPVRDVCAEGDLAAVAVSSYGAVVLNVHDLAHIDTVYRDSVGLGFGAGFVALDTLNHIMSFATSPKDNGASHPIIEYTTGRWCGMASFQGPMLTYKVRSVRDTVTFFGSDWDGLNSNQICKDSSGWHQNFEYVFQAYGVTHNPVAPRNSIMGFDIRPSDGTITLAYQEAGVHFIDITGSNGGPTTPKSMCLIPTPAYDCKWYQGNYVVVAAEYEVVVIDATDILHPQIAARLPITNADRLRGVAIDSHYACIRDDFDGVYVVDMANPRSPVLLQQLRTPGTTSIYANNGRIYVTDESMGLIVYER